MFIQAKDQTAIFHKIKKSIENICNRNVDLEHLQRILTVYPDCYKLTPMRIQHQGSTVTSYMIETPKPEQTEENEFHSEAIAMEKFIDERKRIFRERLMDFTSDEYERFCEKNKLDSKAAPSKYEFNRNAPNILLADLPQIQHAIELLRRRVASAPALLRPKTTLNPDQSEENKLSTNTESPLKTKAGSLLERVIQRRLTFTGANESFRLEKRSD
jgi:hypothetical protein